MKKNWLIRTKNNHILGPVSKDKIKELLKNGSIKGDDEVSSGNGYWIYIREDELLEKYVFGDEIQDFNPVQEAQPCTISDFPPNLELLLVQPQKFEAEVVHNQVSSTVIQQNPLAAVADSTQEAIDEIQYQSAPEEKSESDNSSDAEDGPDTEESSNPIEKKKNRRVIKKIDLRTAPNRQLKNSSKLTLNSLYLLILAFVLILAIAIWQKDIVIEQVKKLVSLSLIQDAHAQEFKPEKKNIGINPK